MYGVSEGKYGFAVAAVCHPAKSFFGGCARLLSNSAFCKGKRPWVPGELDGICSGEAKQHPSISIAPQALGVPSECC